MATPKIKPSKAQLSEAARNNRKELLKELLPLLKSFLLWIVLVIIVAWDYTNNQWFSMLFIDYTTNLSYIIAKMMFVPAQILGDGTSMVTTLMVKYRTISVSNFPMIIELECSAYHAYLAMLSLVAFSAWTWKQKLINGSIIFGILSVVNSLRIVLLGIMGRRFPGAFNTMHDYVWNILLVIVIWALWEFMNRRMLKNAAKTAAKPETNN